MIIFIITYRSIGAMDLGLMFQEFRISKAVYTLEEMKPAERKSA